MTPSNQTRVREARQRLHAVEHLEGSSDSALRLVELQSPRSAERSLPLHPAFAVISGLAQAPRQALAATVDGVRTGNDNVGLAGIIETYGRRLPRSQVMDSAPTVPGSALVPVSQLQSSSVRTAEAQMLLEVVDTIDRATLLSGSELRGAQAAASDLEVERAALTGRDSGSAVGSTLAIRSEDEEMLEALDMVAPPLTAIADLKSLVTHVRDDADRLKLEATVSQARAVRSQLLPGDGNEAVVLADLAIAEADGELAEYDMAPDSPTELLTARLASLGFQAAPFEAPGVADRLIEESVELEEIRDRLLRSIESAALPAGVLELETQRQALTEQRLLIQRRLRSQQQLLAVARSEARRLGLDLDSTGQVLDLRDEPARPAPILVEEPLIDLPARLTGSILSVLLRHSRHSQVICVSDQLDLHEWCGLVGDRADWVAATGWFAGRSSAC